MNLKCVSSAATGRSSRAADTRRHPEDGAVTYRTARHVRRRQPRRRPRSPSRTAVTRAPRVGPAATVRDGIRGWEVVGSDFGRHGEHPGANMSVAWMPIGRACQQSAFTVSDVRRSRRTTRNTSIKSRDAQDPVPILVTGQGRRRRLSTPASDTSDEKPAPSPPARVRNRQVSCGLTADVGCKCDSRDCGYLVEFHFIAFPRCREKPYFALC
jgi:hypothetical protein